MKQALITYIVPVFNKKPYLEAAIASLYAQDYRPLQVVVVDDHSTDGSWELLQELQPKLGFALTKSPAPRSGSYWAANYLTHNYPSPLYGILDADDTLLPGATTAMIGLMDQEGALIVGGQEELIGALGEPHTEPLNINRFMPYDVNRYMDLVFAQAVLNSSHIWSAQVIEQIGNYDDSTLCSADTDYFLRAHRAGVKMRNLSKPVCQVRVLPQTLTAGPIFGRKSSYRQSYNQRLKAEYGQHSKPGPALLSCYQDEAKRQPDNPTITFLLANTMLQMGQHQDAIPLLEELLLKPSSPFGWRPTAFASYLEHAPEPYNPAILERQQNYLQGELNLLPDWPEQVLIIGTMRPKLLAYTIATLKALPQLKADTLQRAGSSKITPVGGGNTYYYQDQMLQRGTITNLPEAAKYQTIIVCFANHLDYLPDNIESFITGQAPELLLLLSPCGIRRINA